MPRPKRLASTKDGLTLSKGHSVGETIAHAKQNNNTNYILEAIQGPGKVVPNLIHCLQICQNPTAQE